MKILARISFMAAVLVASQLPLQAQDLPPFTMANLEALAGAGLSEKDISDQIAKRGIGFDLTTTATEQLRKAGLGDLVLKAVEAAAAKRKAAQGPAATPRKPANDDEGLMPGTGVEPPPLPKAKPPVRNDPLPMPSAIPPVEDDPLPMPKAQAPGGADDPLPQPKAQASKNDDDPLPLPASKPPVAGKNDPTKATTPAKPAIPKKLNPIDELQKTTEPDANTWVGPRVADEKKQKVQALFQEITSAVPLKLKSDTSKHITLIASADNQKKFMPVIKALEDKLERVFPGLIKAGTDKRNAIVILVDSQADYRTWITAEYKAMGMDKPQEDANNAQGAGGNQLQMALNSRGSYLPFAGTLDLSAQATDQDRSTSVCYAVGYLYMQGITEGGAPDCMVSGFANYCESLMYINPMSRVISYEERQIGAGPQITWVNQVKGAVQQRTCSKANEVLNFSTVTMKSLHYAEAWSFVSYLCAKPREFDGLVTALRDKNAAGKAIEAYYKLKDEQLNYQWQAWANSQN